MAKNIGFLICLLIMSMDITAGILGIQAEKAQSKVMHLKVGIFECRYPSHKAFKMGLAAAILLALAHVIANLLGGCICIWSKNELFRATANKQLAVASLIFSWIVLAIAFLMLILGTLANSKSRKVCGLSSHHLLSVGGILCFIHALFTVSYYVSIVAAKAEQKKPIQSQSHP